MRSPLMPISSTACGSTSGIKNFQKFQQGPPTVSCRAVSNLAHNDIVVKAVPLPQPQRQQL